MVDHAECRRKSFVDALPPGGAPGAPAAVRGRAGVAAEGGLGTTTKFTDKFSVASPVEPVKNQQVARFRDSETGETISVSLPECVSRYDRVKLLTSQETGDSFFQVYDERSDRWLTPYDAEAADMERWLLLRYAQRILSRPQFFEDRQKKSKAPYTDLTATVPYCDIETREERSELAHLMGLPVVRNKLHGIPETINHAPLFRVVNCYCNKVSGKQAELWRSKETGKVSWHNVGRCGSVWTCPRCSPKINLSRREEIKAAYEAVAKVGGRAYMLTFTIKHGIGDDLEELASKFKEAMQIFQKSYAFKEVTRKTALKRPRADSLPFLDYIGRIANLEVTHGKAHGWHPHEHHLWFFRRELSGQELRKIRDILFDAWADACEAAGLERPRKTVKVGKSVRFVGLDIREALSAEEYLTKYGAYTDDGQKRERTWGPEKELAGSHVKTSRKGHTPFQLLKDYAEGPTGDDDHYDPKYAGKLFCQFAEAFLGRHQLQFSRSLKTFLKETAAIEVDESEQGDIELANSLEDEADQLGELTDAQFEKVVRNRMQGVVVSLCARQGFEKTLDFINSLPLRPTSPTA